MKLTPLTLALVALPALAAPAPAALHRPDGWITMKAKTALIARLGTDAFGVNVDTVDGRVTLHGKLPGEAQRTQAETAVREIDGVLEVRDLVQVVAPAAEARVERRDEQLSSEVASALDEDALLQEVDVSVASVNDGIVLLRGDVKRLSDELRAMQVVARQPGVRGVVSEMVFSDRGSRFDDELERPQELAESAGKAVRDAWLTTGVKLKLMSAADVPALDINVDTTDAVVTLFGTVDTQEQRNAALEAAREVSGVRDVRDDLEVVARGDLSRALADDAQIEQRVKEALAARHALFGDGVDVQVENGLVHLRGVVRSVSDRLTAGGLARQAGARAVINDLQILR
jgi:hyperosmotically inducible protein